MPLSPRPPTPRPYSRSIVRRENLSFTEAHHLVSEAVRKLHGSYSAAAMVEAIVALGAVRTPRETLFQALDAANFVAIRKIPGGPAQEAVLPALEEAGAATAATGSWVADKSRLLDRYPRRIQAARQTLDPR
jgi:argininosuccinate lyase